MRFTLSRDIYLTPDQKLQRFRLPTRVSSGQGSSFITLTCGSSGFVMMYPPASQICLLWKCIIFLCKHSPIIYGINILVKKKICCLRLVAWPSPWVSPLMGLWLDPRTNGVGLALLCHIGSGFKLVNKAVWILLNVALLCQFLRLGFYSPVLDPRSNGLKLAGRWIRAKLVPIKGQIISDISKLIAYNKSL